MQFIQRGVGKLCAIQENKKRTRMWPTVPERTGEELSELCVFHSLPADIAVRRKQLKHTFHRPQSVQRNIIVSTVVH